MNWIIIAITAEIHKNLKNCCKGFVFISEFFLSSKIEDQDTNKPKKLMSCKIGWMSWN
jgi:hypothetical protein